jgi:hypothetical protein
MEGEGRGRVRMAVLISTKIVLMKSKFGHPKLLLKTVECKCTSSSWSIHTSNCIHIHVSSIL